MVPDEIIRGDIILSNGVVEDGLVVVQGGKVMDVRRDAAIAPTVDYRGYYISPGFVDLHIHGIGGADVMMGTVDAIEKMAAAVLRHGVTSFLPTTVTQNEETTLAAIAAVRAAMERRPAAAQVLGLHLEGPWISPQAKGAQNEAFIVKPALDMVRRWLDAAGGAVRLVTIAPEQVGAAAAMEELRRRGVTVSIGHTTATYDEAMATIASGVYRVTHCFNAMTGLHHREPGVVGASLLADEVFTELIADGVHVHPAVLALTHKVKGSARVVLVTDAIAATDMPEGDRYELGGLQVSVRDGQARLSDGSLAGSVLTMDRAVQNMVFGCGVPLHEAVMMASATAADSIGLKTKGRLEPGCDADMVILDGELRPRQVMVGGRGFVAV